MEKVSRFCVILFVRGYIKVYPRGCGESSEVVCNPLCLWVHKSIPARGWILLLAFVCGYIKVYPRGCGSCSFPLCLWLYKSIPVRLWGRTLSFNSPLFVYGYIKVYPRRCGCSYVCDVLCFVYGYIKVYPCGRGESFEVLCSPLCSWVYKSIPVRLWGRALALIRPSLFTGI